MSAHSAPDGLAEVLALFEDASGGPWEYRYSNGAGCEIYADVRSTMGDGFADLVGIYGVSASPQPRFCIGYGRWVQFPQPHWGEMQEANGRLIVAAVNYLRKHGEAIRELVAAVKCAVDLTPTEQRAEWICHKGITTADKCGRCSRELRVIAALAQLSDTGRKPE